MTSPFPTVAPDFSDPLGLLRACHGRILAHCAALERLVPHLSHHGVDAEAREAIARVHRYFATAAPHHHADEEQDLFPRLTAAAPELVPLMQALEEEHEALEHHWQVLAPLLAEPEKALADRDAFAHAVSGFVAAYRAHALKENEQLLPRAAEVLSPADLRALGRRMAERRHVSLPPDDAVF